MFIIRVLVALAMVMVMVEGLNVPEMSAKFSPHHSTPVLAYDDEKKEGGVLGALRGSALNEMAGVACLMYAAGRLLTEAIRVKWPHFLLNRRAMDNAALQKEQEELWHIVDKIYRGHEERLTEQRNATTTMGAQTRQAVDVMRETGEEMESVKHALSQLSDRMLALEGGLDRVGKQARAAEAGGQQTSSKALGDFKAEVTAKLRKMESGTAKATPATVASKVDLRALEERLAVLQAAQMKERATAGAEQARVETSLKAIRADLPKVLKQHDETVALKLKAYGEELKGLLSTRSAGAAGAGRVPGAGTGAKPKPAAAKSVAKPAAKQPRPAAGKGGKGGPKRGGGGGKGRR